MAIQFDNTWNAALQRRHTATNAFNRIGRMLSRAYLSVKAVQRDAKQRAIYVKHFNNASMSNRARITQVLKLMHDRIADPAQVTRLSYVPDLAAFQALGRGPLPPGVVIANVEAFVNQHGVQPQTPVRIFLCPAFFSGNVYFDPTGMRRTGTGTILHELSHAVAGTADHAYTWHADYRRISANQRANNADSYRAYCQSFDR